MGGTNRLPEIDRQALRLYADVTKAEWCELFVDLYRQCFGDTSTTDEWMRDVAHRLDILNANRRGMSGVQPVLMPPAPVAPVLPVVPDVIQRPAADVTAPVVPASSTPLPAKAFAPSEFQQAIFEWVRSGTGHGVVNAVAGAGKTTTLVEVAKLIHEPALFVAFNKHIADELQKRLVGTPMVARTAHAIGRQAVCQALGKVEVDGAKYRTLAREFASRVEVQSSMERQQVEGALYDLAEKCRLTLTNPANADHMRALMDHHLIDLPLNTEGAILDALPEMIRAGIAWATEGRANAQKALTTERVMDFTDMVFLPYVLDLTPPQLRHVLVDECQDLSAATLDLVMKCCAPNGRMLFVGDPHQSIYGFAGADAESYANIVTRTQATILPLSICYRCPVSVIELAQALVPDIQARPGAPMGTVEHIPEAALATMLQPGDLVLCRMTAPLVSQCLSLIASRVPARVRGKDIGKQLVNVVRDTIRMPGYAGWATFGDGLAAYENTKAARLAEKPNSEGQIEALRDRCQAVRICYESYASPSADALMADMEALFSDDKATITLSTVHRAKGLENPRVFILKPEKLPLVWPGQLEWQGCQEKNLEYVAYTRATEALYFVESQQA